MSEIKNRYEICVKAFDRDYNRILSKANAPELKSYNGLLRAVSIQSSVNYISILVGSTLLPIP